MPGPIDACAMSTGAIVALVSLSNASRNSFFNRLVNSRLPKNLFAKGLFRHAKTIDDAKAFDSCERIRLPISVRIGNVAVIWKPARIIEVNMVSQPVDAESDSCCLNA